MRYPCYRVAQGRLLLPAIRGGSTRTAQRARPEQREIKVDGEGGDDVDDVLESVREVTRVGIARRMHESGSRRDAIEGELALKLHEEMTGLPDQVLGDPDFWRFVALDTVRDFVFWRDGDECSPASFGLNSATRIPDCVPLRMFNRAHISLSVARRSKLDAKSVATSGGADFWKSHVFRVQNRYDPRVVEFMVGALHDGRLRSVSEVRDMAKRIRQERSNLVIELLEDERVGSVLDGILESRGE